MSVTSDTKGHEVYYDKQNNVWRFSDNGEVITGKRPCKRCGQPESKNGHDHCIRNLPGAINACCGHGGGNAYVMFENGIIIRGKIEYPK